MSTRATALLRYCESSSKSLTAAAPAGEQDRRKNRVIGICARDQDSFMKSPAQFRIVALPLAQFAHLFALSDEQLAEHRARRVVANEKPGFPCRVSLVDAEPGESLVLLPFSHQPTESPYRSAGPIFVRENAREAVLAAGEIPELIRSRLLSLRAYDAAQMMVDAEVVEGAHIEGEIERMFANSAVDYLHVHNARRGCFACRVDRV